MWKLLTVFFIFGLTVVIDSLDDAFRLEGSVSDKRKSIKSFFGVSRSLMYTGSIVTGPVSKLYLKYLYIV